MPFTVERQTQTKWCWAAVAVSVDRYFAPSSTWTQCRLATALLGGPNCCAQPALCNVPKKLQDALQLVHRLRSVMTGFLTFSEIGSQINQRRPVCVRIGWSVGGGHFVAIAGFRQTPAGQQLVDVEDPWYGPSTITYQSFVQAYMSGMGTWTGTFLVQP